MHSGRLTFNTCRLKIVWDPDPQHEIILSPLRITSPCDMAKKQYTNAHFFLLQRLEPLFFHALHRFFHACHQKLSLETVCQVTGYK